MMILNLLRIGEILAGLWAIFAIIRWDLRDGEFTTGGPLLAAITLSTTIILLRLLDIKGAWMGELMALGNICIFWAIGRFYYDRRSVNGG
mgnify:CR=1 FL=1